MDETNQSLIIPGWNVPPTAVDLEKSREMFNSLVQSDEITSEANALDHHLLELGKILVAYNKHHTLGIHLIHAHSKLSENTIMYGRAIKNPNGYWNQATSIDTIDLSKTRGHVFKLDKHNCFRPYEYLEGQIDAASTVEPSFVAKISLYLERNQLEHIIGLEIRNPEPSKMKEFDLADQGTVMLKTEDVLDGQELRTTGWAFISKGGVVSTKGEEVHAQTTRGPHKVFINSKLFSSIDRLRQALISEGIIA